MATTSKTSTKKTTGGSKSAVTNPPPRKTAKAKPSLKQKVDAAQKRQAEREGPTLLDRAGESAIEAKDQITAFAKKHPVAAVAGGIAAGIVIAGMFKGPRKAAVEGGTKLAGLAAVGAELAMAYAAKAYETAREAGEEGFDWLEDFGAEFSKHAKAIGGEAMDYAHSASETVVDSSKSAAKAIRGRLN